jgi:hypothetical protein
VTGAGDLPGRTVWPPEVPGVRPSGRAVYTDDAVQLVHGDARDVPASRLPPGSVDLLLTDPPYGMQFVSGQRDRMASGGGAIAADGARQGMRVVRGVLAELDAAGLLADDAHILMFCHWQSWPDFWDTCSAYFPVRQALIWWKDRGGMGDLTDYARDYEVILYGLRPGRKLAGHRPGAVIAGHPPVPGSRRLHPMEKPLTLLRELVERHCPPGGLVLDPFAGSASTLRAAKDVGRRALGVEVDGGWLGERTVARLRDPRLQAAVAAEASGRAGVVLPHRRPGPAGPARLPGM